MSDLGNKDVMAKNLLYYMNLNGKDRKQVCSDLDIKYTTFCDWINAKTYPRIDKIEKLANYFKISKSDLVENKNKKVTDMGFERFNQYKKEKGLTNAQLAAISGVPISTIEKISAGQTTNPKLDTVKALARALDKTLDDFDDIIQLKATYTSQEINLIEHYRDLDQHGKNVIDGILSIEMERINDLKKQEETQKILSDDQNDYKAEIKYFDTPVSAGSGEYIDSENYIMLDLMETPPPEAEFVVRVCGDSMEPTYKDGDKLYIKPQKEVAIGEIGIFYINGDVFVKERGADGLISHNQSYKIIPVGEYDSFKCYGKVIGVCKKYR